MTVARLRTVLGPAGAVVQTVVKRGYRLAPPSHAVSALVHEM
jgi:DNA-binding winged helix-turn-helix (wHTH) protein